MSSTHIQLSSVDPQLPKWKEVSTSNMSTNKMDIEFDLKGKRPEEANKKHFLQIKMKTQKLQQILHLLHLL